MTKTLPIRHLSARVPWHDNKWNGTFCCNVLDNSFCRILPKVDADKEPAQELDGKPISEENMPPCVSEKGTFLSPYAYTRPLVHAWKDINPLFSEYLPASYYHKPFSFNAVPFLWMLKSKASPPQDAINAGDFPHRSQKALEYELDYRPDLEEQVDKKLGFEGNTWVQHPHNQQVLLDSFFSCLKPQSSLVFFYCKHTPLSEPNERVIVGVAKVGTPVGSILNYEFPEGYDGHQSHPWDRCVEHTLTDNNPDGFLLPYHAILEHVNALNEPIELREYAAIAPDFAQFSFSSELVEHDTAIDSLFRMAESLRRAEKLLGNSYAAELAWIDNEVSKIWDMRGAFPGMGPVLSALKIAAGNTIAWELEKYLRTTDGELFRTNPWELFQSWMNAPSTCPDKRTEALFSPTVQRIWRAQPTKKKKLLQLFSRIQMNNDQAAFLVESHKDWFGDSDALLTNPYLIYDATSYHLKGFFHFLQIDKAIAPPEKVAQAFPLDTESRLTDQLDDRRVRSCTIAILEEASSEGHSLLPLEDVLERMQQKLPEAIFPISLELLQAAAETPLFEEYILSFEHKGQGFLKLLRLQELKELITMRYRRDAIIANPYNINEDWLSKINEHFRPLNETSPDFAEELLARKEKAAALDVLVNYRISVLIGPAGSGKTTLLKVFESLPEIKRGGVLKLAPTGKARVKLGHDAQTIAQFLYPDRYDTEFGTYLVDEDAPKCSSARNVIIDEASMLTEEQLAAVLDALGPADRIILVGDYRQLPPIGTGRPFVDIVNLLKPDTFVDADIKAGPAYAELRQIRRQAANQQERRWDVDLSRCFGDELRKEDLERFSEIASGTLTSKHLRLEKWYDSKDFVALLERVVSEELGLHASGDIIKAFNRTLGAKDVGDFQYFNSGHSELSIEEWQIISPVNGYGFGVKEINKFVQKRYRKNFIDLALQWKNRRIAKPKGADNMVYGDKVINLRNSRWEKWQKVNPWNKKEEALNYIANGEIGVLTGEFRGKGRLGKGEPNVEIAFSTQPGYSYVFYPNQFADDQPKSYKFDLAYAITVHKAQGSGFKLVFFVLPAKGAILSRELLYTALTRQEDRIIILHQGEFRDFLRMANPAASATARRFTDLFFLPELRRMDNRLYDARYINVSERGEPMISKNEVIIANSLYKYRKQIDYAYESKLKLEQSGRTIKPDFHIENRITGRQFYWEHLGMMTRSEYREKWELKKQGYLNDGYVIWESGKPMPQGKVLIITEENPNGGIDSQYIDQIIREAILEG
ncbi:MAG: hypothetical protein EOO06_03360 [Chitinophagaceae bacterium]|nr:MAG: hypothetical protein EOO06_03360 [Chitinophagaceae bacterium]